MYVVGVEACLKYFINCLQLSLTLNLTNSIKNIKTTYNLDTFFYRPIFELVLLYQLYIFFALKILLVAT